MECVLDSSTFERPPLLLEHFLFLKNGFYFLERVLRRFFGKRFIGIAKFMLNFNSEFEIWD